MKSCRDCKKKFRTNKALNQHFTDVHLSESEKRKRKQTKERQKLKNKYESLRPESLSFTKTTPVKKIKESELTRKKRQDLNDERQILHDTFSRGR